MNIDASFSDHESIGSCGVVARDYTWLFIAATMAILEHVPDIVSSEVTTLLEGLKLATRLGAPTFLCVWIILQLSKL